MADSRQAGRARAAQSTASIALIGGGGHAKVVISIVRKLACYNILGYTDVQDHGDLLGVPYLGTDDALTSLATRHRRLKAVLAVGQIGLGKARHDLWTRLESLALRFPLVVSPHAVVNEEASAGDATVVMDGVVINSGARIGQGVIVNTNSTIEHDVVIGDWVHVAPAATISGAAVVGSFSMVGAGATIIQGIRIADGCMIGAGTVVVRNLTEPGVYAGCPARRIG